MRDTQRSIKGQARRRIFIGAIIAILLIPTAVIAAGGAFTDDDTSVFEANIEWLAASGVTQGCNPPTNDQFCPEDNVTRGQMAAFMQRFSQYIGAEDGTPAEADNAATLDGLDSTEIKPLMWAQRDTSFGGTSEPAGTERVEVNSIEIDVPVDGYLVVSGGAFINNQAGASTQFALNLLLNGADALAQDWATVTSFEDGTEQNRGNMSYTVTIPVTAGTHTVSQEAGAYSGTAAFFHNQEALTVVFYPGTLSLVSPASARGAVDEGDPQG